MKARNALLAAAGAVGLTALTNRTLTRTRDLDQPLPGDDRVYRWRGMDVAYVEHGDPSNPDLLLLHGINAAGTSKEFLEVWSDLAAQYHVVAPDLPGFGRSDRPPLVYSASLYEDFVRDFATEVCETPIGLASSLTGAYTVSAASAGVFDRLVLVCPTTETLSGRRLWVRTVLRSPLVGRALFNLLASTRSIDRFNRDHGYYDPDREPPELRRYQYETAHRPGARYAPASFVAGYLDTDVDLGVALADVDVPVTLVWGREADITPLKEGRDVADAADAKLIVVDYSKLLPHIEHPEQFLQAIDLALPRAEHD